VARPSEGAFLKPAEVATRLKVSRATVYALIVRIPAIVNAEIAAS
jgi:DNA-binding CsgD family transcriptional regulator